MQKVYLIILFIGFAHIPFVLGMGSFFTYFSKFYVAVSRCVVMDVSNFRTLSLLVLFCIHSLQNVSFVF